MDAPIPKVVQKIESKIDTGELRIEEISIPLGQNRALDSINSPMNDDGEGYSPIVRPT